MDLFILATLLFPFFFNLGFLRVVRLWTLIHSDFFWRTVGRRYDDTRVEDVAKALVSLVTFVFVATGFVYTSFMGRHDGISGYLDALYFTVTSLTTTGYGDITLPGDWGRIVSILIMLGGVTLRCAFRATGAACRCTTRTRCTARPAARSCAFPMRGREGGDWWLVVGQPPCDGADCAALPRAAKPQPPITNHQPPLKMTKP